MFSEVAISVDGLSKCYQIYKRPRDRLLQMFLRGRAMLYREFWALRGITFEVRRGETVGIVGRNGSGKSTLLQLICGTLNPTAGTVDARGRIAALLELGSGFNPEFSGRENVYLSASVYGLTADEIDARFDKIVDFSEIRDFIDQPVKTYSSGMFVRLAFAVVVHVDADILVIDEALAVGDIRFQNKCHRMLEQFSKSGGTILFVSHSPGLVEAFCDHVIWLDGGRVKGRGKPSSLMREYVNAMTHALDVEQLAVEFNESDGSQHDTGGNSSELSRLRQWDWVHLGAQHNVLHVSRMRFESVRVMFNGEYSATVIDPVACKVEVEALIKTTAPVLRPLIGIGVFNDLNEPVVHVNTFSLDAHLEPITKPEIMLMKACIEIPPLRPGDYLISLGVDDGEPGASEVLSHVYGAWAFRVRSSGNGRAQGGYIQLPNARLELLSQGLGT